MTSFPPKIPPVSVLPYAFAIFLSAFLLFQVEPIIARYILPWFGGTPAVWTTCMLFFQVFLLGGYGYAHLLASHLSPRHQALVHLGLVVCSLVFLPITPDDVWKPDVTQDPMLAIILLLMVTIGVPFLLISASGPLLQHWFNRVHPTVAPYRLFALSNLGSLLGLVSYPFFIEPQLGLRMQTLFWSAGYGLYAVMCTWGALPLFRFPLRSESSENPEYRKDKKARLPESFLILSLAACGSVVLLATTNQICRDIAVIPFLWVLPLGLYLISFILCFDHPRWYDRRIWVPVLLVLLSAVVYLLHQEYAETEVIVYIQIFIYSAVLFACCMVCHGELVRLRPPARFLTSFYLMVALGGALGGVFVNLVAPVLFKGYWEFHFGLVATMMLLAICLFRTRDPLRSPRILWSERVFLVGGIATLAGFLAMHIQEEQASTILTTRNFYGVLRVKETDRGTESASRFLYHGRINHGRQFLTPRRHLYPTAYYGPFSGISLAINRHPRQLGLNTLEDRKGQGGLRVGNIGLGVGTTAVYSRPGDIYRFYEINPDVDRMAREYFTYLKNAQGAQQVVLGDGRISLERELGNKHRQQFDILAVDAFSGDGIPVHLLTREAFALYWEHLRPDGILALHITNLHFDFSPVVRALARESGKQALWIKDMADHGKGNSYSDWVLVTNNQAFLDDFFVNIRIVPWRSLEEIIWTDDYSNLFQVVAP
ncbi:spermidine synthase [Nitrospira sp. Ecomares 2.1]